MTASDAPVTPVVEVTGLVLADASGRRILDGTDLSVDKGQIVALVGASGSGKTTLLRAVAGAVAPGLSHRAGRVRVCGQDVLDVPAARLQAIRRTHLGFVGQDPAVRLNPRMRVRHLLAELAADRDPAELLADVGLPDVLARRPGQLSGGQQRRVAIGRAIARRPDVLLLDEPTAGLDTVLRGQIADLLRRLADQHRLAVVLSCHDPDLVARLADTVVALRPVPTARVAAPAHPLHRGPTADRSSVLAVRDLTAWTDRCRRRALLREATLDVAAGDSVAVVGASGAGKTILARAIVGLHPYTDGTVTLHGRPLPSRVTRRGRDERRRVQYVPQDPLGTLNPARTIAATLARPLRLHRHTSPGDVATRIADLLAAVELPPAFARRYPHELSGGQRQRVALARALAADPDLLVCDEVTAALDPTTATAVMELLADLRARRGLALIVISHDHSLVARYTDTALVLADGRVVDVGPTPAMSATSVIP